MIARTRIRLVATIAVSLFVGGHVARADDRSVAAGASASETLTGDVAVWVDAPLLFGRMVGGPFIKLGTLAGTRAQNLAHVVPFHVVSADRELVEIEPITGSDCGWTALRVDPLLAHVHLFVRRDDLAPVIARPLRETFGDGTRIALELGVPAFPTAHGYVVSFSGDELGGTVPAAIGHAYPAPTTRADPVSTAATGIRPTTSGVVALGGGPVTLGPHVFTIRQPGLYPHLDATPARRGDHTLFKLATACGEAVVLVPSMNVTAYSAPSDAGMGFGSGGSITGWTVPEGTALLSTSGVTVAVAAADIPVPAPRPRDKLVCHDFDVHLEATDPTAPAAEGPTGPLRLCVAVSKVTHRAATIGTSTIGR